MENYLRIEDVAERLNLSYKTVFRYIQDGKLKATKIGHWRIAEKDLAEFIKNSDNSQK